MDQKKRDQQQHDRDQRQAGNERNRDMGNQRNEEETGKPVQLDKDDKQHQGGQQRMPESERKPDLGEHGGKRLPLRKSEGGESPPPHLSKRGAVQDGAAADRDRLQ